ncbi:PD-(D/E)XK nuclease family protein [Idiomarina ramblicola]|uniref:PD-(D/E)XK nuclease family protein n=1 Tax=Idiomarina ramblicola TaxID=263724 RepID=A0A432Z616_9GAMM|nr:PD-(D/E)XK nuclease family protein [Idiomarina ramblicola]RUO73283.1 hypothetical protein CWI78_02215 [Idiomarina ramblicola]
MENMDKVERLTNLLDSTEYQEITKREAQFNIFDALGTRRQELRHSDFLAFLLDPTKPHGLQDRFLRKFLTSTLSSSDKHTFSKHLNPVNIRLDNLDEVRVFREKHRYDLMLHFPDKWLVIIENKVGAQLSKNQLENYRAKAETNFPDIERYYLYLTPAGDKPTDEEWQSISYRKIYELIDSFTRVETIQDRTLNALLDYNDYLETHVLEDSKVADLCRKIYREHRDAIDLIVSHANSPRDLLKQAVISSLQNLENKGLVKTDNLLNGIPRFADVRWVNSVPEIADGVTWTSSRKGILFEWGFANNELQVDLVIGPIERTSRDDLIKFLCNKSSNYKDSGGKQYNHISKTSIVALDDIEQWMDESDTEEFKESIEEKIKKILNSHCSNLQDFIESRGCKQS